MDAEDHDMPKRNGKRNREGDEDQHKDDGLQWMRGRSGSPLYRRPWVNIPLSKPLGRTLGFSLLTYNLLSPTHAANHSYLYSTPTYKYGPEVLDWRSRAPKIFAELQYYDADIVCLQEVDAQYWHTLFEPKMRQMGYHGIYKKRTGGKPDGAALFYKTHKFAILASKAIEYVDQADGTDRDNVGLVGLLQARDVDGPCVCIATTHLLFNPRRGMIKLAQIQCLAEAAAELANIGEQLGMKIPIVITGDMNFTPGSLIYEYLVRGSAHVSWRVDEYLSGQQRAQPNSREWNEGFDSMFSSQSPATHQLPLRLKSALRPHHHVETRYQYVSTCHDLDNQLVDFIFYGSRRRSSQEDEEEIQEELIDVSLQCTGYLEPPTIKDHLRLPNQELPSDHVLLLVGFEFDGLNPASN
ncbi:hypothetical protein SmJEL517_g02046 [Synchytrium microbalum]|uniref:Endonuclease/exonuclease/phosphatase domain-containing protein n=1 Tax=Synchytrium microbalum TaxID=1806994 RepID=A0A507C351_9FUNG|nr:uncharacterized protein SmJEL517_g02046 [Synchytrium microbalum]TPX35557.1 hypothetical protein SmJEL517_g02046 [Synchytrium microbalum]